MENFWSINKNFDRLILNPTRPVSNSNMQIELALVSFLHKVPDLRKMEHKIWH